MRNTNGTILLSPSDLSTYAACRHATHMFWKHQRGESDVDPIRDPDAEVLAELGQRHEQKYVDHLEAQGGTIRKIGGSPDHPTNVEAALDAMREGVDAIIQAPLASGRWRGVADVLMRVEGTSELGDYHYEVQDTKLSGNTKAGTVLQLSLYTAWLAEAQGVVPARFQVVSPGEPFEVATFRTRDFDAYTRRMARRFEEFLDGLEGRTIATNPEPVELCQICAWWHDCNRTWHVEDRLVLVPGLGRGHRSELERREIATVAELARVEQPLPFRPDHGSREAYLASAHQAKMQMLTRERDAVAHELLPVEEGRGLARLPEPSEHDLFLDLEGDPFFGTGGLEYLWGWSDAEGRYERVWAFDAAAEKRVLQAFLDRLLERWHAHPEIHVYHYGAYEEASIKRLATMYATHEEELDRLLRANVFVDLMSITRQAARIGVESYSLKDLENVHGYVRDMELRKVSANKRALEHGLMLGTLDEVPERAHQVVEAYNRDDVLSTIALRGWLEEQRGVLIERREEVPRPPLGDGDASEELEEERREATEVIEALQSQLPEDPDEWTEDHQALSLLAATIDFERREDKVMWWEFFAHAEASSEDLERSKKGLVGLEPVGRIGGTNQCPIIRFRIPPQDADVRGGEGFFVPIEGEATRVASVEEVDPVASTIDLKMATGRADFRPVEGFVFSRVHPRDIPGARLAFARDVLERGLDASGRCRAARDLLMRTAGRQADGSTGATRLESEETLEAAKRLALDLDSGMLPVQGPPGTGKTYTGARVIVELARRGRRVGVTAISHKVIAHLLGKVVEAAEEAGVSLRVGHAASGDRSSAQGVAMLGGSRNAEAKAHAGQVDVLGGTAWLWSRPGMRGWADTLVIDEAGQMSLAMALSVSTAATNVILLGDPQQLEQPIQATHPDGADVAALRHVIGEHDTLPEGRGLFLDTSWRLAPSVCEFTSNVFYDGRLKPHLRNAQTELMGTDAFDGTGIAFVHAEHEGRDGRAPEEAELVRRIIDGIVRDGAWFRDRDGEVRELQLEDVLVVAPFNRHVAEIARACLDGTRVGTVDRFQGQEAPVVIYTMGVSSPELAPRGLSFLFSGNRLNVASSRAQARVILVANEALFDAECRRVDDMQLVNAHVRLLEMAERGSG